MNFCLSQTLTAEVSAFRKKQINATWELRVCPAVADPGLWDNQLQVCVRGGYKCHKTETTKWRDQQEINTSAYELTLILRWLQGHLRPSVAQQHISDGDNGQKHELIHTFVMLSVHDEQPVNVRPLAAHLGALTDKKVRSEVKWCIIQHIPSTPSLHLYHSVHFTPQIWIVCQGVRFSFWNSFWIPAPNCFHFHMSSLVM